MLLADCGKTLWRALLLTGMVAALSACGFHLRGDVQLASQLSPLYIADSGPYELRSEIRALLRSSNVTLVNNSKQAAAMLTIEQASPTRRVLSVDASGRAREYEVQYRVRYRISRQSAEPVVRTIKLTRELLFDPDSVLALDYETQTLYSDMRRDAARLMLQQLQALK